MKINIRIILAIFFTLYSPIGMLYHFGTWYMPLDVFNFFMWMGILLVEVTDN